MKKILLLVTALILGGVNFIWATEPVTTGFSQVYSNDFESGSSPWGWSTGSAAVSLTEEDGGNHYMSLTRSSNNYNRSLLFTDTYRKYELTFKWFAKTTAATGSKIQVKFVTSHSTGDTSHYQFRFNDEASATSPTFQICDNITKKQKLTNYTQSTSAPSSIDDFYTVKVASDGTYVRYTLTNPSGTSVYFDTCYSANNALGGIQLQSNTASTDVHYIDDIVLKVPTNNYTINYKLGDDIIKSETGSAENGETINASAIPFTQGGTKYYMNNEEDPVSWTKTGTDEETFNVALRVANTYTIRVAIDGAEGHNGSIYSKDDCVEGESYTVPYPRYFNIGGTLYEAEATSSNYAKVFSNLSSNQDVTISYSATSIKNVVSFIEAENIEGILPLSGYFANKVSNGQGGCTAKSGVATTYKLIANAAMLPAGKYKVTMRVVGKTGQTFYVAKDSEGSNKVLTVTNTSVTTKENTSDEFTLDGSTSLYVQGGYQTSSENGYMIDYVYIQKVAVNTTIGSDGYATYSCAYPLDFSSATDVRGYYATSASAGTVVMTEVTGTAAANEGLFLQKTGEDPTIPVVSSGTTLTGNLLKPTTGGNIYDSDKAQYVFAKQSEELGFYKVIGSLSPASGKAYLEVNSAIAASRLRFVFEDEETTGIMSTERKTQADRSFYNLSGQRVTQPRRGLYIVGGKKVIIK